MQQTHISIKYILFAIYVGVDIYIRYIMLSMKQDY